MSVIHTGSNKKFAAGWDNIFGGKKTAKKKTAKAAKSTKKKTAKATKATKKKAKKKK